MAAESRVGTMIKKRRQAMRMTQEDLAGQLGVSKSTVANWETGKHFPQRHQGAVEEVLGVSLTGDNPGTDWYDQDDPIERGIAEALPAPDARKFIAQLRAARMEHVPRAHEPPA